VGLVTATAEIIEIVSLNGPDILLLDLMMPGIDFGKVVQEVSRISPRTKIIVITHLRHRMYIRTALARGAAGYLSKCCDVHELDSAIEKVRAGGTYVSSSLLQESADLPDTWDARADEPANLTPRQMEVLKLAAEGCSRKEIAGRLAISIKTVEFHRAALLERLGAHSSAELVQYAVRTGVI
jgi:DNA-binding NarL/FixJ family response regulator